MKELDKTLQMMSEIKEFHKKEENSLEEQKKMMKKKHALAILEELELEELMTEESLHALILEDDAILAEKNHKELESEEEKLQEKPKYPRWVSEEPYNWVLKLEDFDSNFDKEEILQTIHKMENVNKVELNNNEYKITLDTGHTMRFKPAENKLILSDFSENTFDHATQIIKAIGYNKINLAEICNDKNDRSLGQNQLEKVYNIAADARLQVTLPKEYEENDNLQKRHR